MRLRAESLSPCNKWCLLPVIFHLHAISLSCSVIDFFVCLAVWVFFGLVSVFIVLFVGVGEGVGGLYLSSLFLCFLLSFSFLFSVFSFFLSLFLAFPRSFFLASIFVIYSFILRVKVRVN